MATTVHSGSELTLIDGTVIKTRPLKISLLRSFMKEFEKVAAVADDNEKSMDVLLDCVAIAMKQYGPELAKTKEELEDLLDLPTVYAIIEAASGVQLSEAGNLLNNIIENN